VTPVRDSEALAAAPVARIRLALALPVLCALVVILLATGPMWLNAYWLRVLSTIFTMAVVAQGINLMAGYTGYPAFGNIVFYGVGGYATAVFMVHLGWAFVWAGVAGTLLAALLALVVGPPLLRLKGHYFAIATLGLNEAMKEVVTNTTSLTGGAVGLSLPLPAGGPAYNAARFYYLLLGAMLLATWVAWEFDRRRLGLGCRAIRDNEAKAEASGLHTTRYKTAAWMISASMTGAVGAVQAWWLTYIDPPSMFDMGLAVKAFVILLLGGAGTVLGPVGGAFVVELLANLTWSKLLNWHLGAMGLIIIAVILLFPDGFSAALKPQGWIGHRWALWLGRRRHSDL
jgi:branched-chain amino acid transport system permease protein